LQIAQADDIDAQDINIDMAGFVAAGTVTVNNDQQSGIGSIKNGNVGAYPEGACVPFVIQVQNTSDVPGDITVSPSFDYFYSQNRGGYGIDELETVTTSLSNPVAATNLNEFDYFPGTAINDTQFYSASTQTAVNAAVSGPYDNIDGQGNIQRYYDIELHNVPVTVTKGKEKIDETVSIVFCARINVDASLFPGASMSVGLGGNGGVENTAIQANQLLQLPSLTLTKTVVGGTNLPEDFVFIVDPAINGQTVFNIPAGQGATGSVTINNVSPDGVYSVTESGPANYAFSSGSGTNCIFEGQTATATVSAAKPANDATCVFTNEFIDSTITIIHQVVNDEGGTADLADFTLQIDDDIIDTDVTYSYNPGSYKAAISDLVGYSKLFSGDCDEDGDIDLSLGTDLTCTIVSNDLPVVNTTGNITVIKVVDNGEEGTAQVSDFNLFVNNTQVDSGTSNEFEAGDYTIYENDGDTGLLDDYTTSFSGDCDGNGDLTLAADEDLTCTITNTFIDEEDPQPTTGTITVVKMVDNGNGGTAEIDDFNLFIGQKPVTSGQTNELPAGNYTITENDGDTGLMDDYEAEFSNDCVQDGNISLAAGENLTCTIINTYIEEVPKPAFSLSSCYVGDVGDDATEAKFGYQANDMGAGVVDRNTVSHDNNSPEGLPLGSDSELVWSTNTYTLGANNLIWNLQIDGKTETASLDRAGGQSTVITSENQCPSEDPQPTTGTITVTKVVENGANGTAEIANFNLFVDQTQVVSGESNDFEAGSYVISENDGELSIMDDYTAVFTGNCDANGNITLAVGEDLICTITNTYQDDNGGGGSGGGGGGGGGTSGSHYATLTVYLEIINDDGGTFDSEDFNIFVGEASVAPGNSTQFVPDSYLISLSSEADGDIAIATIRPNYSYSASYSGDSDSNGNITMTAPNSYTVTITIDDQYSNNSSATPQPTPLVLGITDEPGAAGADEPEPTVDDSAETIEPTPMVLGAADELPRTGFPIGLLIPVTMTTMFLMRRKED
ncbi:MAG: hypothetical protein ABH846_03905, partial [Patescibacteria group bacterium]